MAQQSKRDQRKLVKKDSVAQFAQDLTYEQISAMKELFNQCDKDGDGHIDMEELINLMTEFTTASKREIETLFKELDQNGDQKINFNEFLGGMRWIQKSTRLLMQLTTDNKPQTPQLSNSNTPPAQKRKQSDSIGSAHKRTASIANFLTTLDDSQVKEMKELFRMCDTDGDGVVTKKELKKLMNDLGIDTPKEQFDALFKNLDINDDGKLGFEEFLMGMRWLQKGMRITNASEVQMKPTPQESKPKSSSKSSSAKDKEAIAALTEKNKILVNYIKDIVANSINVAEENVKAKNMQTASTVVDLVDVEILKDMEFFIGKIVDEGQEQRYTKVKKAVQAAKKK
jgi:Ca2+-binding EF-hand superfamily protein